MIINAQTKIAALLKHHPDALEAIVMLSPDFKKLRNPVLRKLMAGRTTIAMACKIGGCKPEDFFEKLKPFGFEADDSKTVEEEKETGETPIPDFIKELDTSKLIPLDVRSMLAEGNDPLKLIQQTVKTLQAGQVLKIINTFEPTPLVKLLEKQGFQSYTDFAEEDLVETYFYKTTAASGVQLEAVATETNDWEQLLKRFENKLQQTDVRHLEMPMPMMTILEALEKLPADTALYVHHKRIPVFLLTELKERNFDYRIKEVSEGEVFLLIFKN
jgi:uncharacterized protein (DUF2249 family)